MGRRMNFESSAAEANSEFIGKHSYALSLVQCSLLGGYTSNEPHDDVILWKTHALIHNTRFKGVNSIAHAQAQAKGPGAASLGPWQSPGQASWA